MITQTERDTILDSHLSDFTVEGKGKFPIDMLRRDQAWPASEDDANQIAFKGAGWGPRRVKLCMFKRLRYPMPTSDRWESFGWKVVEVNN